MTGPAAPRRAVFLDRDGVLNDMVYDEEHGLLDSPFTVERFAVREEAIAFVRDVRRAGFLAIVVTNQPGIAKGTLTRDRLEAMHARLRERLRAGGADLDGVYYCPHHPRGAPGGDPACIRDCECRKPLPGMILRACAEHGVDPGRSYMIGDGLVDVAAGRRAGCRTVLVTKLTPGLAARIVARPDETPDILVAGLPEALDDVLSGAIVHPWIAPRREGGSE